jgi:(R)-2-hydroxyacyl-CoA dehydratese activating ATPase
MAYFMGIDIGSGSSKGVILDTDRIVACEAIPSGLNYSSAAEQLADDLLCKASLASLDIERIAATGCGAASAGFVDLTVNDLRCCARGVFHALPAARTVIDIEGQTTRVMKLSADGQIANFATSEKCASGSGRFVEMVSNVLQIPLDKVGALSLRSGNPVTFTTACAVFGESEVISRVAEGIPPEDILAGLHLAMAGKIQSMVEKVGLEAECAVCGGGALNGGLLKALETILLTRLLVPPVPQMVTALGAALLAQEQTGN